MALAFLRDRQGKSPAREAWEKLFGTNERNFVNLLAYLYSVEAAGPVQNNRPLSRSLHSEDDLYWFSVGNLGVLFSYDGEDLVIIEIVQFKDETEGRQQALQVAEQRI